MPAKNYVSKLNRYGVLFSNIMIWNMNFKDIDDVVMLEWLKPLLDLQMRAKNGASKSSAFIEQLQQHIYLTIDVENEGQIMDDFIYLTIDVENEGQVMDDFTNVGLQNVSCRRVQKKYDSTLNRLRVKATNEYI